MKYKTSCIVRPLFQSYLSSKIQSSTGKFIYFVYLSSLLSFFLILYEFLCIFKSFKRKSFYKILPSLNQISLLNKMWMTNLWIIFKKFLKKRQFFINFPIKRWSPYSKKLSNRKFRIRSVQKSSKFKRPSKMDANQWIILCLLCLSGE